MTEATLIHERTLKMLEAVIDGRPLPEMFTPQFASNPTNTTLSPALTARFTH